MIENKPDPKATKITIQFEDGSIKEATGEDAGKIFEHWIGCEMFWAIHGFEYSGPCLKEIKQPDGEDMGPQCSHKA